MKKMCLQYVTWGGAYFILKHKRQLTNQYGSLSNIITFFHYDIRAG